MSICFMYFSYLAIWTSCGVLWPWNTYAYQNHSSNMQGVAAKGRISREDAATICVEALDAIPPKTLIFEVISLARFQVLIS